MRRAAVYRMIAEDGSLLYVGMSSAPDKRIAWHRTQSCWYKSTQRIELEWHSCRAKAGEAERAMIANMSPKHNIMGNRASVITRSEEGPMNTPREILDGLGSESIAARLGVDHRRVKNAGYDNRLPAAWYATLCEMAGRDLPRDVFTFKRAESA